jgi:hypothetical protein
MLTFDYVAYSGTINAPSTISTTSSLPSHLSGCPIPYSHSSVSPPPPNRHQHPANNIHHLHTPRYGCMVPGTSKPNYSRSSRAKQKCNRNVRRDGMTERSVWVRVSALAVTLYVLNLQSNHPNKTNHRDIVVVEILLHHLESERFSLSAQRTLYFAIPPVVYISPTPTRSSLMEVTCAFNWDCGSKMVDDRPDCKLYKAILIQMIYLRRTGRYDWV